jgi:hypothetical protein
MFESNLTVAGVATYSKRFFDEIPLHLSWMRSYSFAGLPPSCHRFHQAMAFWPTFYSKEPARFYSGRTPAVDTFARPFGENH